MKSKKSYSSRIMKMTALVIVVLFLLPQVSFASRTDLTLKTYLGQNTQPDNQKIVAVSSNVNSTLNFKEFIIASYDALGIKPKYTQTPFVGVSSELIPYLEDLRLNGIVYFNKFSPEFNENRLVLNWKAASILLQLTEQEIPPVFDVEAFGLQFPSIGATGFYAPTLMRGAQLGYFKTPSEVKPFETITTGELSYMLAAAKKSETTDTSQPKLTITPSTNVDLPAEYADLLNDESFLTFLDVYKKVTTEYVEADSIDHDKLIYGAISGLVDSLDDPYSAFQDPEIAAAFQNSLSNEIQGIGASLDVTSDDQIIIVTPLSSSPAEKVGLRPGDIITAVNGVDIVNMDIIKVISLIQGPTGTKVTLTIKRNGTTTDYTITRARITVPSVTAETTFDNILYVKVSNFGFGTSTKFKQLIEQTDMEALNGLIVDLRFNPGGYLGGATDIGDLFVEKGTLLTRLDGPSTNNSTYAKFDSMIVNVPTVVLVNEGTASAAEILAGILQDYHLATVVGQTTFGKGTVQQLTTYSDSSALKLTIAKWLTPNGRSINGIGLTPDVKITQSESDRTNNIDSQKEEALRILR